VAQTLCYASSWWLQRCGLSLVTRTDFVGEAWAKQYEELFVAVCNLTLQWHLIHKQITMLFWKGANIVVDKVSISIQVAVGVPRRIVYEIYASSGSQR
jgi:hypothetical protein